jgi:hypothetical protein
VKRYSSFVLWIKNQSNRNSYSSGAIRFSKRGDKWRRESASILRDNGVPQDSFIAQILSSFNPDIFGNITVETLSKVGQIDTLTEALSMPASGPEILKAAGEMFLLQKIRGHLSTFVSTPTYRSVKVEKAPIGTSFLRPRIERQQQVLLSPLPRSLPLPPHFHQFLLQWAKRLRRVSAESPSDTSQPAAKSPRFYSLSMCGPNNKQYSKYSHCFNR